jgi:hypothetical protein
MGTINVGDRQRGRLRAASMIDCTVDRQAIDAALQQSGVEIPEPAARRVKSRDYPLEFVVKKTFYESAVIM